MNGAHRINDTAGAPGTGAPIVSLGTFPARRATVTADVLARFINGERLTGLDAVADASTTRLAAVVHYLETEYRWTIERTDKAAGCKDGRIAWVSEYWMGPELRAAAVAAGAEAWCAGVRLARRTLRTRAPRVRTAAARFNDRVQPAPLRDPRQGGLFDSEGALA
jgi:hypothetical protein